MMLSIPTGIDLRGHAERMAERQGLRQQIRRKAAIRIRRDGASESDACSDCATAGEAMSVPTTYATIDVQTERLGELLMELTPALSSIGMSLRYVITPKREAWAIVDDRASALMSDQSA